MNRAMKLANEYQRVEAVVTFAVMAWFTVALVLMVG